MTKTNNDNFEKAKNAKKDKFCCRIFWVGVIVASTFIFAGYLKSNKEGVCFVEKKIEKNVV